MSMPGDPLAVEGAGVACERQVIEIVPIEQLRGADSPRLAGVNEDHARTLAESVEDLPAILVQYGTMRVIDGMHRVRAAQLRQQTKIKVRYVDADDESAFLRGVAENIRHGLPLTLADRKAAAVRIVESNPAWSDRAVARATGLSNKTVAALRQANSHVSQPSQRVGQDGKVRPINSPARRQRAGELLARRPDAPIQEVAAVVGLSTTTVRDVRDRMCRGEDPIPLPRSGGDASTGTRRPRDWPARTRENDAKADVGSILRELSKDPALQFSEAGRTVLRWLRTCSPVVQPDEFVKALPPHSLPSMVRLTRHYAVYWASLAQRVQERARDEQL